MQDFPSLIDRLKTSNALNMTQVVRNGPIVVMTLMRH
jgi:hypothetical protein